MEFRLRFFNFNMGNSAAFAHLDDIYGAHGPLREELAEPFACGTVDLAFISLVETRVALSELSKLYGNPFGATLDKLIVMNACKEGARSTEWMVRGWLDGLAEKYNGNLKSVVAFNDRRFQEDTDARLFGRMTEVKVAGVPVPNPKKAFMGRTFVVANERYRFSFIVAHLPVFDIAAALERTDGDPLQVCKEALARRLRKILRAAYEQGVADDRTAIFVQGDLNSRTCLRGEQTEDVLLSVLNDRSLQATIQHGVGVPQGRWFEVVEHDVAASLPVTYKFHEQVGQDFCDSSAPKSLTIGEVVETGRRSCVFDRLASDAYRRTLEAIPAERLNGWGLAYSEGDFRPFRFPSATDRVICWAPLELADRMSFSFPRTGYEVVHLQGGSDHRPVSLDVVVKVAPPGLVRHRTPVETPPELLRSICQEDDDSHAS